MKNSTYAITADQIIPDNGGVEINGITVPNQAPQKPAFHAKPPIVIICN